MRDERKESRHRASVVEGWRNAKGEKEGGKFEDKSTSSYAHLKNTILPPVLLGVYVAEIMQKKGGIGKEEFAFLYLKRGWKGVRQIDVKVMNACVI